MNASRERPPSGASALDKSWLKRKAVSGWTALDPAERVRRIARVQSTTHPRYAIELDPNHDARYLAQARGGLTATFEKGEALVSPSSIATDRREAAAFNLAASAWGCAEKLEQLVAATPLLDSLRRNRIEYVRVAGELTEWFVNGPLGLEQGWSIERVPTCAQQHEVIKIRVTGSSTWNVDADGKALVLRDGQGKRVRFGEAISVDASGKILPTSAHAAGGGIEIEVVARGARLPITVDPLIWIEQGVVRPSDGQALDWFGGSVSLGDETLLVGAPLSDADGLDAGVAYLYGLVNGEWQDEQILHATDSAAGNSFGFSVDLSGNVAVVGAPEDSKEVDGGGSAHFFARLGGVWETTGTRLAATPTGDDHRFGYAVAVDGNWAVIGAPGGIGNDAPGSAFVFEHAATGWEQRAVLQAPASVQPISNLFGIAVAISGNTIVVGAPHDQSHGMEAGSAHVFSRSGATWPWLTELTGEGVTDGDHYGSAVAIHGEQIAVGAEGIAEGAGAVFAFSRGNGAWAQTARLDGLEPDASFGEDLAMSDSMLAITMPFGYLGTVFPFAREGDSWHARPELIAPDDGSGDTFATAIAVFGSHFAVGSPNGLDAAGSVHMEALTRGSECTSAADCATGHCVEGVCCDAACESLCYSCLVARNGVADGTCAPAKANTDPRQACGGASCIDSSQVGLGLCNGQGACEVHKSSCGTYTCIAGTCVADCTEDQECAETSFCNGDGHCERKQQNGAACEEERVCASGQCVDGVCCNAACDRQCEACAEPDTEGKCVAVTGAPRGERMVCPAGTQQDPCAEATCDGKNRDTCADYVGASTACQPPSCADGVAIAEGVCDDNGGCIEGTETSCGAYACAEMACWESCKTDMQCADGAQCEDGACVHANQCSSDEASVIDARGDTTDCWPFKCRGGTCIEACTRSSECADELECNPNNGHCEELKEVSARHSSSCAFDGGASDPRPLWWLLGFASVYAAVVRRGGRHRHLRTLEKHSV